MLWVDKADRVVVDEIVVGDTYCEENRSWVRLQWSNLRNKEITKIIEG